MLLLSTWFGSFLLDGDKVAHQRLFPKDPAALAERLALVEDWKVLPEERELMSLAEDLFVLEPRLERAGGNLTKGPAPFLDPEAFGYSRDLLHATMVHLAKARVRRAIGPGDHLRQAVGALDEIQEQENALVERLREWYGLHFPELAPMVNTADYVNLIAAHGRRENMPIAPRESIGADLAEREEGELRAFASDARRPASRLRSGAGPSCRQPAMRMLRRVSQRVSRIRSASLRLIASGERGQGRPQDGGSATALGAEGVGGAVDPVGDVLADTEGLRGRVSSPDGRPQPRSIPHLASPRRLRQRGRGVPHQRSARHPRAAR